MYLDESDFDEIKRQKRQINRWTTALTSKNASLIKDGHSSSKPKMTFYNHSKFIESFIEAADVISAFKEPVNLHQKTLERQKRQTMDTVRLTCFLTLDDGITFTDIDLFVSAATQQEHEQVEQFCLFFTEDTTVSAEIARFLMECQTNSPSFPFDGSCQLLADRG